jgi:glyoxylase-like metal-dependent hydrolase (beta-lactamase superfamily II)/rhodanese-related sulfurtransferase
MKIEQIYTGCLAQGAYYLVSGNEAVIIDPLREIEPYLERAKRDGVQIKYILETHFHADFVSGHVDLAKATGATIVYGPNASPSFDFHSAKDGEFLHFGALKLEVLHTPGHTMESTCFLLYNAEGNPEALFSGDTLFIGDVGRPDLAQKAASMTQEELAGLLFDSLRSKIMTLPDAVTVYPAHGAGSACGKNMSKETVSTIGEQKTLNYALRADMGKAEFVSEVIDGLLPPPGYFGLNVAMNKQGYESITEVMKRGLTSLSVSEFEVLANEDDVLMLDTRPSGVFTTGFIPNSISIGLDGQFAPWVGALIPNIEQKIILITEEGHEEESVKRLSRVGYDKTIGFLKGGFHAWAAANKEVDSISRITAEELAKTMDANTVVIDVRKPGEFEAEHMEGAKSIPLDFINNSMGEFPKNHPFILHCAGGYRSVIAASILKSRGYDAIIDVIGGFSAIAKTSVVTTKFTCPSKAK